MLILVLFAIINVYAQMDDSIKYDIIQVSLTSDILSEIEQRIQKRFSSAEAEIKMKKMKKMSKNERERRQLETQLKRTTNGIKKLEIKKKIEENQMKEKEIEKWQKFQLKLLQDEKDLLKKREERLEELKLTSKAMEERVDDFKTQLDSNKDNQQIQFNYNVSSERLKVIKEEIKEIEKRRKEQKEREKQVEIIRESIKNEKEINKRIIKKINKKIREVEKKKDELALLELVEKKNFEKRKLKEELLDMRERQIKSVELNAAVDLKNALERDKKMRKIIALMHHQKKYWKNMKGRQDICPTVQHQLDKRIKYFQFMENKGKERLNEAVKAIKRYQLMIETQRKELYQFKEFKITMLNKMLNEDEDRLKYYMSRIEEIDQLNNKGKINFEEYTKKNNKFSERKRYLEERISLLKKKINAIGDQDVFEKRERERHLRKEVRELRRTIGKLEEQMSGLKGKIEYFNKRAAQMKEVAYKVIFIRRSKVFHTQWEEIRKVLVEKKQVLGRKKVELEEVSMKIIRHEEEKVEKLIQEKEEIEKEKKFLKKRKQIKVCVTKGMKKEDIENQKKEVAGRIQLIKEEQNEKLKVLSNKMEIINSKLSQLRNSLSDLRIEKNFWKAKDAFKIKTEKLKRIQQTKGFIEKTIQLKENELAVLLRGNNPLLRSEQRYKKMVEEIQELIGYKKEELVELEKLELKIMKKALFKGKRFEVIGKMALNKAIQQKDEIEKSRRNLIIQAMEESDDKKHSIVVLRLEENERKLNEFIRIEIESRETLKWARKIIQQIQKELNKDKNKNVKTCKQKGDCPLCRKLAELTKKNLLQRKEDGVVLKEMERVCKKFVPNKQTECFNLSLKIAEHSLKIRDPLTLNTDEICRKIGVCGL